ncbi:MAG: OstA-like protein, partial [Flavisolibacter sp.]
MKRISFIFLLTIFFICAFHLRGNSQDTTQPVSIIRANNLYWKKIDATTELQILAGQVRLKQGNTLFDCDSCVINGNGHIFEAFGKVHINDNDTTNVYSDYLRYLTDTKMAYLNGNVKLTDGRATL